MATKKTTTEKGLGWRHEQAVEELKRRHKDGSPCEWCGRPMWLDPTRNYDYNPEAATRGNGVLQGDHGKMTRKEAVRLGVPIPPPDRLLHQKCNTQRGGGENDHLSASARASIDVGKPAMDWPWQTS